MRYNKGKPGISKLERIAQPIFLNRRQAIDLSAERKNRRGAKRKGRGLVMKPAAYWDIVSRAFREALEFVRWPKPSAIVTAAVAALGIAAFSWLSTGHFIGSAFYGLIAITVLFLVVFAVRMIFFVPLAMINEARDMIPVSPEREVDGIYQAGELVGRAEGVSRQTGAYSFSRIVDLWGFDPAKEFEYKDVVLYNNATNSVPIKQETENGSVYQFVLGEVQRKRKV